LIAVVQIKPHLLRGSVGKPRVFMDAYQEKQMKVYKNAIIAVFDLAIVVLAFVAILRPGYSATIF